MGFLLCQYIGKQEKYFANYKMSYGENYFSLSSDNMNCNNLDRSNRNKHYQIETLNKKLHIHRKPVQRAASHLYRSSNLTSNRNDSTYRCFGPEFVVKASRPSKRLLTPFKNGDKIVTIILLDGQKLDVPYSPSDTTAAQLLRVIIQEEHIDDNFMFGLSALIAGDFIFVPSDVRICKVKDVKGSKSTSSENLTLYLRVRFFLPTLRGMRDQTRHFLYLQLRRSILDHQLRCSYSKIVELTGLALQAEFGNFDELEHGKRDYFLLEHYIPDTMICNTDDVKRLKEECIMAHVSRTSLERERAEQEFIILTQKLPYYGGHFYSAILMLKHNSKKDVWLFISSQGIKIYEREKSVNQDIPRLYEMFDWKTIQTLCYTKHYFCILSHSSARHGIKSKKYTLKMDHKKSFFFFRLASLHHQFFLKVRIGYTSLDSLSQQFGILVENQREKDYFSELNVYRKATHSEVDVNVSEKMPIEYKEPRYRRIKSAPDLTDVVDEPVQNDINMECEDSNIPLFFGLPASSSEKKKGVKMGTRAFPKTENRPVNQRCLKQISLESISLHGSSTSTSNMSLDGSRFSEGDAYVLDSVPQQNFLPNFEETINSTLLERLNGMSFAEERNLIAIMIERDSNGSLGLQITEGSDGNVYVQSIIIGGSAYWNKGIMKGDQVVAVNGQSLLGRKYSESLKILKNATGKVQLIISRLVATYTTQSVENSFNETNDNNQENLFNPNSLDLITPNCVESSELTCPDGLNKSLSLIKQTESSLMAQAKYLKDHSTNIVESLNKLPTDHHKPTILEMIPRKNPIDNGTIINSDFSKLITKGDSPVANSLNVSTIEGNETIAFKKEPMIALPRSLGLGRKWKGPVRYPVTPIKKVSTTDDGDVSTSDEDQVFL